MSMFANPSLLLIMTGALIGLNFPLGKIAGDAGISPVLWAMIPSVGVAALMLPVLVLRRGLSRPNRALVQFAMLTALISYVIPGVILFAVIPHAGSGYMGLMFAQSPSSHWPFRPFGLRTPNRLGLAGIAVGLISAIVSLTRGAAPDAPICSGSWQALRCL